MHAAGPRRPRAVRVRLYAVSTAGKPRKETDTERVAAPKSGGHVLVSSYTGTGWTVSRQPSYVVEGDKSITKLDYGDGQL